MFEQYVSMPLREIRMHLQERVPEDVSDCQTLMMFRKMSFPCQHINMSEVLISEFDDAFPVLMRDHAIMSVNTFNKQTCAKCFGLMQLQDTSFIFEMQTQQLVQFLAVLKVEIPPFTQNYIHKLTKAWWPNESAKWQVQFAKGISLIRDSLPAALTNSYSLFDKMYTAYYITYNPRIQYSRQDQITELFSLSKDLELCRGNIHSLFLSLRNRSDVTSDTMTAVAERLATLSILRYLDSEGENPWKDSTLLIKSQTQLIPAWEKFVLDKSIDFAVKQQRDQGDGVRDQIKATRIRNRGISNIFRSVTQFKPDISGSLLQHIPSLPPFI